MEPNKDKAAQAMEALGQSIKEFKSQRAGIFEQAVEKSGDCGYKHKEAFCLMRYQCNKCGHHEIIWNSRDGVTPFGTVCPSCNGSSLTHAWLGSDRCVPDHKPNVGQRIWIGMTLLQATKYVDARISRLSDDLKSSAAHRRSAMIDDMYRNGEAPDLAIHGYTRDSLKELS